MACSDQKNAPPNSAIRNDVMRFKRQERYRMMSAEKKAALLLHQRTKRQEVGRGQQSEAATFTGLIELTPPLRDKNVHVELTSALASGTMPSKQKHRQNRGALERIHLPESSLCAAAYQEEIPPSTDSSSTSAIGLDQRVFNLPSTSEVAAIWSSTENVELLRTKS